MGSLIRDFLIFSLLVPLGGVLAQGIVASRDWSNGVSDVYDQKRCGLGLRLPKQKQGASNSSGGPPRRRGGFIMGGRNSTQGEYPWAVAIYHKSDYKCTGTLITKRHVITAAHCFSAKLPNGDDKGCAALDESLVKEEYSVWQGGECLPNATDCAQSVATMNEYAIVKSSYGHFYSLSNCSGNDYALLELSSDANSNASNHICLPHKLPVNDGGNGNGELKVAEAKKMTAHGWGMDPNHYETAQMNHLQVLEMEGGLLSRAECEGKLSSGDHNWTLPADGICIEEWKKNDTCAGDSGGGLITKHESRYFLVGVLSFGSDCTALMMGNAPKAQIFTSVMAHAAEIDAFVAG